jgi:hypothetical protein
MTFEGTALENASWAFLRLALDYNAKLAELALVNICSAFEYARKLSTVRSSSEFVETVSSYTRDQFEALSEQVEELSALTQRVSPESAEDSEVGLGD